MTLLILYGALAIGVSFLCSLLEACLLSLPRSYVESMVEGGSRVGRLMQQMKDQIDRPLAAILTLNTIAHTVGAAGVGAQAAEVFGNRAVGLASAAMTLLILVLSEIVPKTLGAVHAKLLAVPSVVLIRAMIFVSFPLIVPLEWINRLVRYQRQEDRISRAELMATIRLGQAHGAMHERESRIASNVIALSDIPLGDVLTPRTVVFSLSESLTVQEAVEAHHPIRFARIPIHGEDPEQVTGYVHRFALYAALSEGNGEALVKAYAKPLAVLPELVTVGDALELFMTKRQQIALVVDEYGGMAGLVTLEDVVETLLGEEIIDETDAVADMQELARRRAAQRREGVQARWSGGSG